MLLCQLLFDPDSNSASYFPCYEPHVLHFEACFPPFSLHEMCFDHTKPNKVHPLMMDGICSDITNLDMSRRATGFKVWHTEEVSALCSVHWAGSVVHVISQWKHRLSARVQLRVQSVTDLYHCAFLWRACYCWVLTVLSKFS